MALSVDLQNPGRASSDAVHGDGLTITECGTRRHEHEHSILALRSCDKMLMQYLDLR